VFRDADRREVEELCEESGGLCKPLEEQSEATAEPAATQGKSCSFCSCMRAYVSIRQHTSAYVSIRQHTSSQVLLRLLVYAPLRLRVGGGKKLAATASLRETSACVSCGLTYVSIRQHTSAYVSIRQRRACVSCGLRETSVCQHTSAYVSIRQHTSAYVSIRQRQASLCLVWPSISIDSSEAVLRRMLTYADVC
jgi:hypothetical protein